MTNTFNYIGEIKLFSGATIPEGWLLCDGRELPINEYEALASLLGNLYGGTATTFCLPDLRSRIPLGQSTAFAQGSKGGKETVILETSHLPAHQHTPACNDAGNAEVQDASDAFWAGAKGNIYALKTSNVQMNDESILPEGDGMPHENRMPVLAMSYIIAESGTLPNPH